MLVRLRTSAVAARRATPATSDTIRIQRITSVRTVKASFRLPRVPTILPRVPKASR
jgi:hypothetical protein